MEEIRFMLLFPKPVLLYFVWFCCQIYYIKSCLTKLLQLSLCECHSSTAFFLSSLMGWCICIMYQLQVDPEGVKAWDGGHNDLNLMVFLSDCLCCSKQTFEFCVWLVKVSTYIKWSIDARMKGQVEINKKRRSFPLHIKGMKLSSGVMYLCRPGMSRTKKKCLGWVTSIQQPLTVLQGQHFKACLCFVVCSCSLCSPFM